MKEQPKEINLTLADRVLIDLINEGQSGKYLHFVRAFTGRVQKMMKLKNPLSGSIMVSDLKSLFEILNPEMQAEIEWFRKLEKALKSWVNEKIIANRLLGLKDDNSYDTREFEKVVMEKFGIFQKPDHGTIIETDFKTLVEMVELGARRFGA